MSTLLALALSLVVAMPESARFPTVTGKNLEGRPMTLPADFAGQRNVVFVAFKREQQDLIDTRLPPLHEGVSRTLRLIAAGEHIDDRFDSAPVLARYPMTLTRLEDWARARVGGSPRDSHGGLTSPP